MRKPIVNLSAISKSLLVYAAPAKKCAQCGEYSPDSASYCVVCEAPL